jgi:hypothetical protein
LTSPRIVPCQITVFARRSDGQQGL